MESGKIMLEVTDLTVNISGSNIVDQLSFTVSEGQWLMVVGPNGAGKTTAIRALAGDVAYIGTAVFDGKSIKNMRAAERASCIGVLSQTNAVGYAFSVEEIVRLGCYAHKDKSKDNEAVEAALTATGLKELRDHSVMTLSGGERQRTFLAQVLAQDPRLLILDEPATYLDPAYQKQTFEMIGKWLESPGRAVISVVHDLTFARMYGSHALLMNEGRRVAYGPACEVLTDENFKKVYGMDIGGWMREMLNAWN